MTALTERHTNILDAAIREFDRHGFSGTDMEAIAAEANVSRREIYRYYLDKDSIFNAIVDQLQSSRSKSSAPPYSPGFPIREQLSGLVESIFRSINDKKRIRLTRIILAELAHWPELARSLPSLATGSNFATSPAYAWLREAIAAGGLRQADPATATRQLKALIRSLTLWPMLFQGREPLSDDEIRAGVEQTVDFFLSYYGIEGK